MSSVQPPRWNQAAMGVIDKGVYFRRTMPGGTYYEGLALQWIGGFWDLFKAEIDSAQLILSHRNYNVRVGIFLPSAHMDLFYVAIAERRAAYEEREAKISAEFRARALEVASGGSAQEVVQKLTRIADSAGDLARGLIEIYAPQRADAGEFAAQPQMLTPKQQAAKRASCGCTEAEITHDFRTGGKSCQHGQWSAEKIYDNAKV